VARYNGPVNLHPGTAFHAALLVALIASPLGCEGDKKPEGKGFSVQIDGDDHVTVGFGVKARGEWDEVRFRGDGSVKWIHTSANTGTQEGFEKTVTLERADAAAWLQSVVDIGLLEIQGSDPGDGVYTQIEANIDGHKVNIKTAGLPRDDLRGKLDQLTARTLQAPK
jgi:hypothetical protein